MAEFPEPAQSIRQYATLLEVRHIRFSILCSQFCVVSERAYALSTSFETSDY